MEVVTERLLHTERKQKAKSEFSGEKAMATKQQSRGPKCYNCHKFGHIQKYYQIKEKKLD